MQGRSTFVIAHPPSTIENADRVWPLEVGGLIEEGTCAGLLAARGL